MTLDIDGKKFEEPDDAAIANGFESIDKRTGFRAGLSLAILSRDKENSLAAMGHPAEGWGGLNIETNGFIRTADISPSIRQEKLIQIFQSYAKGDELWEKEFQWEILSDGKWPVKRIIFLLAILLMILFFARSCLKGH